MPLRKQQNNMSMRKIVLKHKALPKQQPLLQKALLTATFAMLSSDLFAQRWRGEYDDITPTPWWLSMFIVTAFLFYLWIRKSKRLKYLDIKNNYVTIDPSSLPHTSKMFLLTNGIEIIGILTNKQGKVIKKSSLIFEESDDILEDKELIKNINIKYTVDKINKSYYLGRIVKEKEKYINNYLKKINKLEDEYLLKYLYYDIYNIDEVNIDKIYNNLINLTKKDINKIYECIKRVELELKQQ